MTATDPLDELAEYLRKQDRDAHWNTRYMYKLPDCQPIDLDERFARWLSTLEVARQDARRYRWTRDPENDDHPAWKILIGKSLPATRFDKLVDAALKDDAP